MCYGRRFNDDGHKSRKMVKLRSGQPTSAAPEPRESKKRLLSFLKPTKKAVQWSMTMVRLKDHDFKADSFQVGKYAGRQPFEVVTAYF